MNNTQNAWLNRHLFCSKHLQCVQVRVTVFGMTRALFKSLRKGPCFLSWGLCVTIWPAYSHTWSASIPLLLLKYTAPQCCQLQHFCNVIPTTISCPASWVVKTIFCNKIGAHVIALIIVCTRLTCALMYHLTQPLLAHGGHILLFTRQTCFGCFIFP